MLKAERAPSARMNDPGAFSLAVSLIEASQPRTCIHCSFRGPEPLFKKSGSGDRRCNVCKRCDAERAKKREAANRDLINAQRRARYRRDIVKHRTRNREKARSARGREINRQAVARYKKANPERTKARHLVSLAVRRGDLIRPKVCQALGCSCAGPLHAHHGDYSRPLAVDWLCMEHHEATHHQGPVRLQASANGRKFARPPKDLAAKGATRITA